MLEEQHHLGYKKNEQRTNNRRNGHGIKSVRSDYGEVF